MVGLVGNAQIWWMRSSRLFDPTVGAVPTGQTKTSVNQRKEHRGTQE